MSKTELSINMFRSKCLKWRCGLLYILFILWSVSGLFLTVFELQCPFLEFSEQPISAGYNFILRIDVSFFRYLFFGQDGSFTSIPYIQIWLYFFTYIKCSILFTDHGRGKGKEERNEKETVRLIHAVNMKCAPTSAWRFSFSFENYKRAAFKSSFSVQGCSSYEDIQRPECGDKNWF